MTDDGPHSFTMTPMGILAIGDALPIASAEMAPAVIPSAPQEQPHRTTAYVAPTASATVAAKQAQSGPLTGKQILAMVRARVKEIRKVLPALQAELASLEPIIAASKPRKKNIGH